MGLIPARAGKTIPPRRRGRRWAAHPRACGENKGWLLPVVTAAGSSPRVRGKPRYVFVRGPTSGLIPARAGKTSSSARQGPNARAHPRACGENLHHHNLGCSSDGSSPRVRGKPHRNPVLPLGDRLIPARAGKTPSTKTSAKPSRAHPRACGENFDGPDVAQRLAGSSPRVRGKPPSPTVRPATPRLIPARAGKTPRCSSGTACSTAHPRACGENGSSRTCAVATPGSSPRVRGKPPVDVPAAGAERLIPARAGKTTFPATMSATVRAHPRACGENASSFRNAPIVRGSSPRVRGKRLGVVELRRAGRLIPARAGKTPRCSSGTACSTAHPRACGENGSSRTCAVATPGSSPRVRGKPRGGYGVTFHGRLIPARAGKTTIVGT